MSAAKAFYPEVGACTHDFPLLASARMFLSEFNDVSEAIFIGHGNTPFTISSIMIIVPIITYHLPYAIPKKHQLPL
jgi:hypothetical protein